MVRSWWWSLSGAAATSMSRWRVGVGVGVGGCNVRDLEVVHVSWTVREICFKGSYCKGRE